MKAKILSAYRRPELLQTSADLLALDRQSHKANSGVQKFSSAAAGEVDAHFILAANKTLEAAFNKIMEEYNGNVRKLTDMSRGSIELDSVSQIRYMQRLINPERQSPFLLDWAEKGYFVRRFKDTFAEPTNNGHRALHVKIEVPLSRGDFHICELQIRHRGFHDATCDATHALYEEQRAITRQFNHVALSDVEAAHYAALGRQCREIHDAGAEAYGLKALEKQGWLPGHDLAA